MNNFNARPNFPEEEQKLLARWKEQKIFERSVDERPAEQSYTFYDGPPFATGLPHYGHLLQSLVKDMVPRFWTMNGYRVERRWGWDCHGLPIENIVEKELDLNSRKDILDYGVDKFNNSCHSKILQYADEWKKTITRFGRWVDMDNDYKTMDVEYMNSVWWVFKALWDRDLIYQGRKSMHICPRCETVLSNFEVAENYQDIDDLSVIAKFRLADEENTYVLAWTTTPWTLPGNMLLAAHPDIAYVKVRYGGAVYIVAENRADDVFAGREYTVVGNISPKDMEGKRYEPLFPYFADTPKAFRVVLADFVTADDGTGIVHIAPGFGEDDAEVGKREALEPVMHVQMNGRFTNAVTDFAGRDAKSSDADIVAFLSERGAVFHSETYTHSYPHCWRCDTPLLNYTTTSWFVAVAKLKDEALRSADAITWMPAHVKEGRFGKWLENAKDWAISRSRYWGAPLPIWRNVDDPNDVMCIGSKRELEELSGKKIDDLHKHIIDTLEIHKDGKTYKRIDEVLDCWFESGAMPYAQAHYPHENADTFMRKFPADFIAEAQDQTTRWFYVLHVLATALTMGDHPALPVKSTQPAFKNVVVSGIVLAEDGKKMSKRLQNYPEPDALFERYGVDSVRYYLATSPVMKMGNMNFSEKDVAKIFRKLVLTLWNVLSFYALYDDDAATELSDHLLDKWVLAELERVKKEVTDGYRSYDLNKATRPINDFVQELSTWYVRRSRHRFKGSDTQDKAHAVATLRTVLRELSLLMAPVTPFLADMVYRHVDHTEDSVHLAAWPQADHARADAQLLDDMRRLRTVIEAGHAVRAREGVKLRQPLARCDITIPLSDAMLSILQEELNVQKVRVVKALSDDVARDDAETVGLDVVLTDALKNEGALRELIRFINASRKKRKLTIKDIRPLTMVVAHDPLRDYLASAKATIESATKTENLTFVDALDKGEEITIGGEVVVFSID